MTQMTTRLRADDDAPAINKGDDLEIQLGDDADNKRIAVTASTGVDSHNNVKLSHNGDRAGELHFIVDYNSMYDEGGDINDAVIGQYRRNGEVFGTVSEVEY